MYPEADICTTGPSGHGGAQAERASLVGREQEIAELESLLFATRTDPPPVVVLHGRRGIGKTTLAAALAQRATAHRVSVVWAVQSALLDVPPHSLVILDDAPEADAARLERLALVMQSVPSVRVLMLCRGARYRVEPVLAGWLERIDAERGCRFQMLRPLAPEAADALVRAASGEDIPAATVVEISRLTAGDPTLIKEFAREFRRDRDNCARDQVPETVTGAVALRLASLGDEQQRLAETMSLFSGPFAVDWLAAASALTGPQTLTALRLIEDAGLVEQSGDDRFEMSAPALRDAVRSLAFGGDQQRAHRRLAETLMRSPEDTRAGAASEIARQYDASRAIPGAERGAEPALQAAGQALAARSPLRAAELLELGLGLCVHDQPALRARLTGALAKAWAGALRHADAVAALELACQWMRAAEAPSEQIADLVLEVASALPFAIASVDVSAPKRIRILVGDVDQQVDIRLESVVHARLPQMCTPTQLGDRMVRVAMAGGRRQRTAALFRAATETIEVLLDPALTRPLLAQAHEEAAFLDSNAARSLAYSIQAVAAGRAGDLPLAKREAQAGVDAYLRLGRALREPPLPQLVQLLTLTQADPDWDHLAASSARLVAEHWPTPYAVSLTAVVALARERAGDHAGARTALQQVLNALEAVPRYLASANAALGPAVEAAWRLNDRELGKRLTAIADRLLAAGGGDFYMSQRDLVKARLARVSGRPDAAASAYRAALQALDLAAERPLRLAVSAEYEQMRSDSERPGASGPDGLTRRQLEVLVLLSEGLTNQQIAERLVVSINTVNRHVADIYRKIGAPNRVAAASYVARHGLA